MFMIDFNVLRTDLSSNRTKPEYIIGIIEKYLHSVNTNYPVSLKEIWQYYFQFKRYKKNLQTPIESISRSNKIAEEISQKTIKQLNYISHGKQSERLNKKLEKLEEKLRIEVELSESFKYNNKELNEILKKREDILMRSKLTEVAMNLFLKSNIIQNLITLLAFSSAFLLSYFMDDYIEEFLLNRVGHFFSKFIPAIIFFTIIDKQLNKFEENLVRRHVSFLIIKAEEVFKLELTKTNLIQSLNQQKS
jgi:hypothetical protein